MEALRWNCGTGRTKSYTVCVGLRCLRGSTYIVDGCTFRRIGNVGAFFLLFCVTSGAGTTVLMELLAERSFLLDLSLGRSTTKSDGLM